MNSSSTNIKMIIFDLDGTLVDAYRAVWVSLNLALKEFDYPKVGFQNGMRSVGWGERHLIGKFVPPEHVESVLKVYRDSHREALKKDVKLLPGAGRLIKSLKKNGYQLAIASNRSTEFCEIILDNLKIRQYFDIVLCADKVKRPKPAGDILQKILEDYSLKTSEVLYVGDMTIDIEAGRNAKIKTVAVTTGSCEIKEIRKEKPFKIIKNIYNLLNYI